jgi:hypothetical protein
MYNKKIINRIITQNVLRIQVLSEDSSSSSWAFTEGAVIRIMARIMTIHVKTTAFMVLSMNS